MFNNNAIGSYKVVEHFFLLMVLFKDEMIC